MLDKGISRGELTSVIQFLGGVENVVNRDCRDKDTLALFDYLLPEAKLEKLLGNPQLLKTPVVRNGRAATVGYQPDIWKQWE